MGIAFIGPLGLSTLRLWTTYSSGTTIALAQAHFISLLQMFKGIETREPVFEAPEEYKISTESKNGAKVALIPALTAWSRSYSGTRTKLLSLDRIWEGTSDEMR